MKKITIVLSCIFLTYCLVIGVLGYSALGIKLIQKALNNLTFGTISIQRAEGRLLADWLVEGVDVRIPGADISLAKMEGDWRPAMFLLGKLQVENFTASRLVIRLKEDGVKATSEDTNGGFTTPPFLLPIAVHFGKILLEDVSIVTSTGEAYTIITTMESKFDGWGGLLSFSDFSIQGPDYALAFHGSVDVLHDYNLDLVGQLSFRGFGFHQLHGTFSFTGPLNSPKVHLGVSDPAEITIDGEVENLLISPEWRGILTARDVDLSTLFVSCPKIDLHTVYGDIAGDTDGYRGHVEALGSYDNLEGLELVSDIDADWLSIDFHSLRLSRDHVSAVAKNAKISWYSLFEWEGEFSFKNIDTSVFSETLQGTLTADLVSKGDVKDNGVVASFVVSQIEGVLNEQTVNGKGAVFLAEDRVYTDGFKIGSGEFDGAAHIQQASFSWAAQRRWSGDVLVENFDPSWLHSAVHGQVNGHFLGGGSLGEDGPEAHLQLTGISGSLLGNDLSGGGEVWVSDNTFRTTGLVLKNGPSQLSVQGMAGNDLAIDFLFFSPDIGQVLPQSSGNIRVEGNLSGGRMEPELALVFQGTDLSYQENSLSSVKIDLKTVFKEDGELTGSAELNNLNVTGMEVDQCNLDLTGTLAKHQVSLHMVNKSEKLSLKAQGRYTEVWQGELFDLKLDSSFLGHWLQGGRAKAQLSSAEIGIDSFCLQEGAEMGSGRVCLNGNVLFNDLSRWSTDISFQSIALDSFDFSNILSLPLEGTLEGNLTAKGDKSQVTEGKADILLLDSYFDIENYFDELDRITFEETVLDVVLVDNHLQGTLSSRMDNGGTLSLSAEVSGIGVFSARPDQMTLNGLLELDDFDLSLVDSFTSYSVDPEGKLFSNIKLGGTVASPQASGSLSLEEGGIDLPLQGIILSDVSVDLKAEVDGATVKAKAKSGSGQLNVEGKLQYKDFAMKGDLRIRGADFTLFNLPEYVIDINPDVRLLLSKDEARLEGEVVIPYGVITPEAMRGSISVSEDVVFIDGEEDSNNAAWPVYSSMKVVLGEDVSLDGYGLKGNLTGEISVEMVPYEILTGKGELALVGGTFDIYGRLLDINRGRVLFTGGPINNPGLDVRAQKEVTDGQALVADTVGVDISGLVQDLKFDLFSDPNMDDADILSQLIVGGSFGNSSESENNLVASAAAALGIKGGSSLIKGLGSVLMVDDLHIEGTGREEEVSLVVGKRFGKRLYIGYDMNMFSQLGQFRVRYYLEKGFAVETTSSTEATGADLLYSFEK